MSRSTIFATKPPDGPSTEALAGLVERVTFHSAENGFCVLRVRVRGRKELVTVVGHAATISAGEFVQATGNWVNDRTHGVQFRADFLKATAPNTAEGIEKYLGSGMIRGVGPAYAKRLVQTFGEAVFDVIEQSPQRLREVPGIGPWRAERIREGWAEQQVVREIMLFLHSHGVEPTALMRVRAGISHALAEAMEEGHCGLPLEDTLRTAAELLGTPRNLVETALELELAS